MINEEKVLSWFDLSKAPQKPGVYAWYLRPELLDRDIQELVGELAQCKSKNQEGHKHNIVRLFLRKRIFSYFEQKPYRIELTGALKPRFSGEAKHSTEDDLSDELIGRISDDPSLLYLLKKSLNDTSPMQASPLYIGMADNLKKRIAKHKGLIIKLENEVAQYNQSYLDYDYTPQEINFAERVLDRNIPPTQLYLTYCETESKSSAKDIENILNRIYFPILGRN